MQNFSKIIKNTEIAYVRYGKFFHTKKKYHFQIVPKKSLKKHNVP